MAEEKYGVTNDEIMDFLKENMVTKQELDERLGRLRSELIDYLDKRLMDLKGDLVVIMKSEDRKLNALIELLVQKSVLTVTEAKTITKLEPFPQAA